MTDGNVICLDDDSPAPKEEDLTLPSTPSPPAASAVPAAEQDAIDLVSPPGQGAGAGGGDGADEAHEGVDADEGAPLLRCIPTGPFSASIFFGTDTDLKGYVGAHRTIDGRRLTISTNRG
jgi:hypothetical protein